MGQTCETCTDTEKERQNEDIIVVNNQGSEHKIIIQLKTLTVMAIQQTVQSQIKT